MGHRSPPSPAQRWLTLLHVTVEAGRMTIEMIPFSLRTAVFSVLKTLCVKASEQTLDLIWHLDPNVPDQVIGDPLRLRQVCREDFIRQDPR